MSDPTPETAAQLAEAQAQRDIAQAQREKQRAITEAQEMVATQLRQKVVAVQQQELLDKPAKEAALQAKQEADAKAAAAKAADPATGQVAKRVNWIITGMTLLYGPLKGQQPVPGQAGAGAYQLTGLLQEWLQEGTVAGFVNNPGNPNATPPVPAIVATYPVQDSDFTTAPANYPAGGLLIFNAAVAALGPVNVAWQAGYAALVALKP